MTLPPQQSIKQFWDKLASSFGAASVIDSNDKRGSKNHYIALTRTLAVLGSLKHFPAASCLLDFGCGSGNLLAELALAENCEILVGADISFPMLQTARQTHPSNHQVLVQFDGARLPFASSSLDVITLSGGVLIYIHDDAALEHLGHEFIRVLRPGGGVIAVEQIRRKRHLDTEHKKVQRPPATLLSAFESAGFDTVESRPIRRGRFPLVYAIRYGWVPKRFFSTIARFEARLWKNTSAPMLDYADALFVFKKPLFSNI